MKSLITTTSLVLLLTLSIKAQFTTTFYREASTGGLYSTETQINKAGDFNADGVPDVIVGSFEYPFGNPLGNLRHSTVQVLSGIDGSILFQSNGDTPGDLFGFSVNEAGDVNADGYDDIIIGMPHDATLNFPGGGGLAIGPQAGAVKVISGSDGSTLYKILGSALLNEAGQSVAGLDDINNDGFSDFAFTEVEKDTNGVGSPFVRVISGVDGTLIFSLQAPNSSFYIQEIANAGDVNGDGTTDIIVGLPVARSPLDIQTGLTRVYSGANGDVIHTIYGEIQNENSGTSVDGIGDINNDGFDDFIIGEIGHIQANQMFSRARVFSGSDASVLNTVFGTSETRGLGHSVAGLGDFDGDGVGDYAVSQADETFPVIRVFSGATHQLAAELPGPQTSLPYTQRVSAVGDVNNDGKDDIFVGAFYGTLFTSHEENEGELRLYLSGIDPVINYTSASGNPPQLDLNWTPAAGNPNDTSGILRCSGATPGGNGLILASLAPADIPIFGFDLLAAVDPTNLVLTATVGATVAGEFVVSDISRRNPIIAGSSVHVQFIEISPLIRGSNAVRFIAIP